MPTCTEGCGRGDHPQDTITKSFNYSEQNGYLKILIRSVLGIYGRGGEGLIAL